jgi:hypothetical protein
MILLNEVVREECGVEEEGTKIETNMLRWFGHVERADERRLTKEIYGAILSGNAVRGRPRQMFFDQIEQVLKEKKQVKSTRNRRACMRNLMKEEEAKRGVRIVASGRK